MKSIKECYALENQETYLRELKAVVEGVLFYSELAKVVEKEVKNYQVDYYVHDVQTFKQKTENDYLWIV